MQGFPLHIATRQDYENLLNDERYRDTCLEKIQELRDYDDSISLRAVEPVDPDDPMSEWITEEIPTPFPLHVQRGFSDWDDVVQVEAAGICLKEDPKLGTVELAMESRKFTEKVDTIYEKYNVKPIKEEVELVEGIK